jgi:hypothetical protein
MGEDAEQLSELKRLITAEPNRRGWFGGSRSKKQPDVIAYFKNMPEPERRALTPQFFKWRKEAARIESTLDERQVWLCLFATATLSEIKRYSWWGVDKNAITILVDRKVPWLQEWVELAFEHAGWGDILLEVIDLVEQGLIDHPEHENYAIDAAYLSYSMHRGNRDNVLPIENIRPLFSKLEYPIWRQFEVEGGGEKSLAQFDKYLAPKVGGKWSDTLVALSKEGLLDRQRLLDASLDALNRGFKQFRASWFSRFHEQLQPSVEERSARAARYLDLVSSPVGPTVSLALAALKKIQKAGLLDAETLVRNIEPAMYTSSAKAAKEALQLLANAIKTDKGVAQSALLVAAASLEHPKSDVQETGLAIIEGHSDKLDEDAQAAIAMRLEVVSPVLKARANALVGTVEAAPASEPAAAADLDELASRAEKLPDDLRVLAGINLARQALEGNSDDVPIAPFNGMDVPRLDPAKVIEPIATFEEFVDQALVAIEHSGDLDLVERVLAGAVRFAADRPDNDKELALQIVLGAILATPNKPLYADDEDPRAVMVLRTDAMAAAVHEHRRCNQFSTPTHAGCWIDPCVLVERTRDSSSQELGLADQCLALLRMAPDRRDQALAAAKGLEGEWASALRYALGGNEKVGKTLSLWVAAARARAPFADDENVIQLTGVSRYGENLAPALCYSITWGKTRYGDDDCTLKIGSGDPKDPGTDFGKECWTWDRNAKAPNRPPRAEDCLPTVGLSQPQQLRKLDTYLSGDMVHLTGSWATAIWPQHPEPVFALSAKSGCMLDGVVGFEPATEPLADGLILVHDRDVPVGPMAVLMLARGLNALDKAAAQATVDALIAVIEDGRLDGRTFGTTMHELLMGGIIVAKRWSGHLRDIARASPLHAMIIRKALQRAIYPGEPQRPLKNMHAWLEILHELSVETGEAIEDALARDGLVTHFKTGQARKLAKVLLDLKSSGSTDHRTAAIAHALEHRIARAERWAARTG